MLIKHHLEKPANTQSVPLSSSLSIPILTTTIINPHKQTRKIISNGKNYNFHRKEFRRKKETSVGSTSITTATTMRLRNFLNILYIKKFSYIIPNIIYTPT